MTNHRPPRPAFLPVSFTLTQAQIDAVDSRAAAAGHHNRSLIIRELVDRLEPKRCPCCGLPHAAAETSGG